MGSRTIEMVDMAKAESDWTRTKFSETIPKMWTKILELIKRNLLLCTTIVGVVLGFALGFIVREYSPTEKHLLWIGLPGQLYLRLFQMLIVPLIICAVISGTSSLDPKSNGKISLSALVFIIASDSAGSALGIGFSLLFQPGVDVTRENTANTREEMQTADIFIDLILNIVPDNLFEATFAQTQTKYRPVENSMLANSTDGRSNVTEKYFGKGESPNITGLILACILFGIACAKLGELAKPFLAFVRSVLDIVTIILKWCMWTTPIGVISQIAVSIAAIEDVTIVFKQMGMFVATITASVAAYQLILMPFVLFVLTKRNPYYFLMSIAEPYLISFATGNPAIAIPEMLHSCEVKNKIDRRVAGFVIPLSVSISCSGCALYIASATIFLSNMSGSPMTVNDYFILCAIAIPEMLHSCEVKNKIDRRVAGFVIPLSVSISCSGCALYIASATIFLSNMSGSPMTVNDYFILWVLATIASLATPAIPNASIVSALMVMKTMNVEAGDIALLLALEWLIDRLRTTCTAVSHMFCAASVNHLCINDLEAFDKQQNQTCDTEPSTLSSAQDALKDDMFVKADPGRHLTQIEGSV